MSLLQDQSRLLCQADTKSSESSVSFRSADEDSGSQTMGLPPRVQSATWKLMEYLLVSELTVKASATEDSYLTLVSVSNR